MKIQKTELATKLNQIKGVVPKKTTMPILQGILVKEGYLIDNNLEMTVEKLHNINSSDDDDCKWCSSFGKQFTETAGINHTVY